MTFSYGNDPANSPIDAVRLRVGDTVESDISLSDQEISYFIVIENTNILPASISAAYAISAKATKLADEVTGEVEVKWSQRARNYITLAERLTDEFNGSDGSKVTAAFAGGISINDMVTRAQDPDRVTSQFHIGQDNNIFGIPFGGDFSRFRLRGPFI